MPIVAELPSTLTHSWSTLYFISAGIAKSLMLVFPFSRRFFYSRQKSCRRQEPWPGYPKVGQTTSCFGNRNQSIDPLFQTTKKNFLRSHRRRWIEKRAVL